MTRRDLSTLLLALAAASVDAVIILAFGVLVSAQTGNTVLLGVALAQGHLAAGLRSAISVVGSIVGASLGELIIVRSRDSTPWPSVVGWALVAELGLLSCLFVYWHLVGPTPAEGTIALLVALAALAMGTQSAATLRLGTGATTTYVTGMLTTFTTDVIQWLHMLETAATPPQPPDLRSPSALGDHGPWLAGPTWLAFGIGAVVGGLLFLHIGDMALILPIAAILVVVLLEARRP
jgi:uncharacterized membrane protein YoaK (UPF0700 family)